MSIHNQKGTKVFQQMLSSAPTTHCVIFNLPKEDLIKSKCQQLDGSLTFCWKIFTHVIKKPVSSSADAPVFAVDCTGGLSSHLDGFFAAMFQNPTKENLTNQIKIEDIEPEVFHALLRFIYTGRVLFDKMESMAAGLFIAADKYLLDELKMKCENYMLLHMSPDNCLVLLLHGASLYPTEALKEAATFFRRFPSQVMANGKRSNKRISFCSAKFNYIIVFCFNF